jgi:hypothetical protein
MAIFIKFDTLDREVDIVQTEKKFEKLLFWTLLNDVLCFRVMKLLRV